MSGGEVMMVNKIYFAIEGVPENMHQAYILYIY